jgi:hypothetical protein
VSVLATKKPMLFNTVPGPRKRLSWCRDGGRYDPRVIVGRLDQLRAKLDVPPKEIGAHIWPKQEGENAARAWYKRTTQMRQPFSLPEIDLAVDYLEKRLGYEIPGFPFIDVRDAERIGRSGRD